MVEALLDAWREHPSKDLGTLMLREPPAPDFAELMEDIEAHGSIIGLQPIFMVMRRHLRDPRLTPLILQLAKLPLDAAPVTREELCELWRKNRDPSGSQEMALLGAEPLPEVPLPADALELVEQLKRPVPVLPELASVYAEPQADAPRHVLADALLEHGDDWGELIALQLGTRAGAEETQLRANLDGRLGELLGPGVTVLELDRGFPVKVRAQPSRLTAPTPAWRLVKELKLSAEPGSGYVGALLPAFLHAPELAGLETLWDLRATLQHLEPGRCRISTFGFTDGGLPLELGELLGRLPSARKLVVNGASYATALQVCADPELERFELVLRGDGWRLHWAGEHVDLECGARLAGEWYDVFRAAAQRAQRCRLRVVSKADRPSLLALGRTFALVSVEQP